jgi:hypothetical protein
MLNTVINVIFFLYGGSIAEICSHLMYVMSHLFSMGCGDIFICILVLSIFEHVKTTPYGNITDCSLRLTLLVCQLASADGPEEDTQKKSNNEWLVQKKK